MYGNYLPPSNPQETKPRHPLLAGRLSALSFALLLVSGAVPATLTAGPAEPATTAAPLELEQVLSELARIPGLAARFREEKRLSLLVDPLESSGTIYFAPPGRLARHTDAPIASTLVVDGERLQFSGGGERGTLELDSHALLRAFADAFRMFLRGDLPGLRRMFVLDFRPLVEGDRQAWELLLVPRDRELEQSLKEIRIRGGEVIEFLQILETNGDDTTLLFSDVDADRQFSESELATLFELPNP